MEILYRGLRKAGRGAVIAGGVFVEGVKKAKNFYQSSPKARALINAGTLYGGAKIGAYAAKAVTGDDSLEALIDMSAPVLAGGSLARSVDKHYDAKDDAITAAGGTPPSYRVGRDLLKTGIGAGAIAHIGYDLSQFSVSGMVERPIELVKSGFSSVQELFAKGADYLNRDVSSLIRREPAVTGGIIGGTLSGIYKGLRK